jgi:hypothetical protein
VDLFLHFLHDNPSLLPPVVEPEQPEAWSTKVDDELLVQRRTAEGHMCLKCGLTPCAMALIAAHPLHGRRWLDVCHACLHWLKGGMDPLPGKG